MAQIAGIYTDYVNYRLQRKEAIRSYLMAQAATTASEVAAQWRFLQAEQEAAQAIDKDIEDLRQRIQSGVDTRQEAAARAEGTARTALIQAGGAADVARIQARGDIAEATIRGNTQLAEGLTRSEREATSGAEARAEALRTTADPGKSDSVLLDNLTTQVSAEYGTRFGQLKDPLQRAAFLAQAARDLDMALAQARPSLSPAIRAQFRDDILQPALSVTPDTWAPGALEAVRSKTLAEQSGLLGANVGGLGGGSLPSSGGVPGPQTRAALANTSEAGLDQLAVRAALAKFTLEQPERVEGKTAEELLQDPVFQAEAQFLRNAAPMVDLLTYGDDRVMDLLRRRQEAQTRIDEKRSALDRRQATMPDIREIENQATLAFTDLYGRQPARDAVEAVRRTAELQGKLGAATYAEAEKEIKQLDGEKDADYQARLMARAREYLTTATTRPPAADLTRKDWRQMGEQDAAEVRADLARQQAEREFWMRQATAPAPETAQEVAPATLDALINRGFKPTDDGSGDRFQGSTRVREAGADVQDFNDEPPNPFNQEGVPEAPKPPANPADPFDGLNFEADPAEEEIILPPGPGEVPAVEIGEPTFGDPALLMMPDEAVPRYASRGPKADPSIQIPLLLAGGRRVDDLSAEDKAKVEKLAVDLKADAEEAVALLKSAPKGSDVQVEAALQVQEIMRAAQILQKAMKPATSAQDVEDRRLVKSADAGVMMGKDAVQTKDVTDPAAYLKQTFGKNVLKPTDIQLTRELAKSKHAPTGPDLTQQLMRIAGGRWIKTDVREQLRALYVALRESMTAVAPEK